MAGKIVNRREFPWFCDYTEEDLQSWFEENEAGFGEWYGEQLQMWNQVQQGLPPGCPNYLAFEDGKGDVDYQAQLNAYHTEQAQERLFEKH